MALRQRLLKAWKLAEQRGKKQQAAIAILNVGSMDDGVERRRRSVSTRRCRFLPGQLTGIEAMRIDAPAPLFLRFRPRPDFR